MSHSALLRTRDLAAELNVPLSTLRRKIAGLRRDHGFPSPVPGMGGRYDPITVRAWRRRQAGLDLPDKVESVAAADDILHWQDELDRRSAALAKA